MQEKIKEYQNMHKTYMQIKYTFFKKPFLLKNSVNESLISWFLFGAGETLLSQRRSLQAEVPLSRQKQRTA